MAKHTKGKHTKPKALIKFSREKGEGTPEEVDASQGEQQQPRLVQPPSARHAHPAQPIQLGQPAPPPQPSQPMPPVQPQYPAGQSPQMPQAGPAFGQAMPQPNAQYAQSQGVQPAQATGQQQAQQATGQQTQEEQDSSKPKGPSHAAADGVLPKKPRSKHWLAKRIAIISASIVGTIGVLYLAGVIFFTFHYMPNTHISTVDISFMTQEEVQQDFDLKVYDYSFKVKGKGMNVQVASSQAGIEIDSVSMTHEIARRQNPWKWPVQVFEERDATDALSASLSAPKLANLVQTEVNKINATAKDPVDAYAAFDEETGKFEIVPEVKGTKLDYDRVLANILIGVLNLDDEIVIMDNSLVPPAVLQDDRRLAKALNEANEIINADIQLTIGGSPAIKCTPYEINNWVTISPEFTAVLNEEQMVAWANEVADMFNTVGSKRTFTRADGKEITVQGGDYGWVVDSEALAASLVQAIKDRVTGELEVPVTQAGSGYTSGGKDWGARYIDVDISEQYARFYGDNGEIIWESAIVSGAPNGRSTPTGVYDLNTKGRNVTLTGRGDNGEITYQTPVAYWMPFIRNSIGFHDATWQSSFGGQRYRQGAGSHGCINLPLGKAQELYGLIEVGDVVVVHN